jgi:ribonuclease P protein component
VLYVLKNSGGTNRLGISVSKKVGCSVVRSRVTRLIRESYRTLESGVIAGSDLVFIARSGARSAVFADIKSSVNNLLKKQHIMAEAEP